MRPTTAREITTPITTIQRVPTSRGRLNPLTKLQFRTVVQHEQRSKFSSCTCFLPARPDEYPLERTWKEASLLRLAVGRPSSLLRLVVKELIKGTFSSSVNPATWLAGRSIGLQSNCRRDAYMRGDAARRRMHSLM